MQKTFARKLLHLFRLKHRKTTTKLVNLKKISKSTLKTLRNEISINMSVEETMLWPSWMPFTVKLGT